MQGGGIYPYDIYTTFFIAKDAKNSQIHVKPEPDILLGFVQAWSFLCGLCGGKILTTE
jgi:hypothetical protein